MPLDWQIDNKTFRELGSYRFTTAQTRSMELRVDIEIVSTVKDEYYSLKSNPKNGHFGYAVLFQGSTPYKRVDLEFPITRVLQVRNDLASIYVGQWFLAQRIAEGLQTHYDCISPAMKVCLGLVIADPANLVVPGHPDTIVKVKTPKGSQFNIIVYWVDIPGIGLTTVEVDPSDPGDGLDEYPEPKRNDPNDPWNGNPDSDPNDPANDPRDYGDNPDIPPPPFTGGQCLDVNYTVTVRRFATISPAGEAFITYNLIGPIKGVRTASSVVGDDVLRQYWIRHGEPEQETNLGDLFVTLNGEANNPSMTIATVVRGDGGLDNCGDPPPIM